LLLLAALASGCQRTLVVGKDAPDGAPPGPNGPASLTEGLIAYWKLDDGPGSYRAMDRSGHADHAIPEAVSASDWLAAGRIGGALLFGNAGWLRGTAVEGVNTIRDAFSIGMWIRLRDQEDREQAIMQRQAGTGTDAHFVLGLRLGRPALGGVMLARCEAPALPTGRWVHLAATFDGSTERLLFDGVEVVACPGAATLPTDTTVLTVGGRQFAAGQFMVDRRLRADLDEVALWSRALAAGEVQALAAGQVPPVPPVAPAR
jgi:hypothetical protein